MANDAAETVAPTAGTYTPYSPERSGPAFRARRMARGDRLSDVGRYIGTSGIGNVSTFERGQTPNLMLGTALRYLAIYGLTLIVAPVKNRAESLGVAS